jgi:uncharacterized protein
VTHPDARALVSLFVVDRHTVAIREFMRAERHTVGVSDFASAEFASAIARRGRLAWLTAAQGGHLLKAYDGWVAANAEPVEVGAADVRVASPPSFAASNRACERPTPCTSPSATGWNRLCSPSTSGKP